MEGRKLTEYMSFAHTHSAILNTAQNCHQYKLMSWPTRREHKARQIHAESTSSLHNLKRTSCEYQHKLRHYATSFQILPFYICVIIYFITAEILDVTLLHLNCGSATKLSRRIGFMM